LWPKGSSRPKELRAKDGAALNGFIPWPDYIEHATFDPTVQKLRFDELMSFAADLHEFMRDHAKLTESEKPLLVSGTLIALRSKGFVASYGVQTPAQRCSATTVPRGTCERQGSVCSPLVLRSSRCG
jgi:type I restriction enzyme M protein